MEECEINCRIEQLLEDQLVARAKADILRQALAEERDRLQFYKNELERDRQEFIEKMKIWYPPPPPCTCNDPSQPQTCPDAKTGDYTVQITNKDDFQTNEEEICVINDSIDEKFEKEKDKKDCILIQFEKQLVEEMLLKMQLEAKGQPRQICPCKTRENNVIQPFPPSPHSHTTYFKTELIISDIQENHDIKAWVKLSRTDYIKKEDKPTAVKFNIFKVA